MHPLLLTIQDHLPIIPVDLHNLPLQGPLHTQALPTPSIIQHITQHRPHIMVLILLTHHTMPHIILPHIQGPLTRVPTQGHTEDLIRDHTEALMGDPTEAHTGPLSEVHTEAPTRVRTVMVALILVLTWGNTLEIVGVEDMGELTAVHTEVITMDPPTLKPTYKQLQLDLLI